MNTLIVWNPEFVAKRIAYARRCNKEDELKKYLQRRSE